MLSSFADSLLSVVYPQPCVACGNCVENRRDGAACKTCWTQTRIFTGSETLCSKCGAYLRERPSLNPVYCQNCTEHFYDSAHAVGVYEKALAAVILELKSNPSIPKTLRGHIRSALSRVEFSEATIVIPVPLSAKRRHERGFNQAEIVAAFIASETGLRVEKGVLERTVHTAIHRVAMDRKKSAVFCVT